jgi:metal-responsive CopG/Arc/MetJ family transcriptional regulator
MNHKHEKTEGGASVTSWFPGDLIEEIYGVVKDSNQTRSRVIAEAVRFGLKDVRRKYAADSNGEASCEKETTRRKNQG